MTSAPMRWRPGSSNFVALIDDFALFVGTMKQEPCCSARLLAAGDHRQLAGEHEIDFFRRRSVWPGAAAGQIVRQPTTRFLEPPALAPNRRSGWAAVIRGVVCLASEKRLTCIRIFPPLDPVAALRIDYCDQPDDAAVAVLTVPREESERAVRPATLSMSPLIFRMPRTPFLNRMRCTGSQSGK